MFPILVVDDDPMIRQMLQRILAYAGWPAEGVADGQEAAEWLARRRPGLLLLDLSLPTLDGEELAARLRARFGADVPILAISASDQAAAMARRIGALSYLPMPFEVPELLRAVQQAFGFDPRDPADTELTLRTAQAAHDHARELRHGGADLLRQRDG